MEIKDINRLRELACKIKELSMQEQNTEKAIAWQRHNDLVSNSRPMVFCDPENGWNEIIPQNSLVCEDGLARMWEFLMIRDIFSATQLKDDKVIDDTIYIGNYHSNSGWGLSSQHMTSGNNGAYKAVPAIDSYDKLSLLKYPQIVLDTQTINEVTSIAHQVFDGILNVKYRAGWWWSLGLSNTAIELRGLENFMLDMYDYPDELHSLMNFLCEGNMRMIDYLETKGMLSQNTGNSYVGSGGFGFTNQIKDVVSGNVTAKNMWGFTESQETVSVSPDMFEEFVFPYQLKIAKRFGLNCYGCCEGLERRWHIIKNIPNLRRVSVSHWADAKQMAENLSSEYIFSLKPSPSFLATSVMESESARQELKQKIAYAKANNCHIEIIMKDNHTLGNNPQNAVEWVKIARQELQNM